MANVWKPTEGQDTVCVFISLHLLYAANVFLDFN